jgi:DNA-binding beta-propeller fold protein YncE
VAAHTVAWGYGTGSDLWIASFAATTGRRLWAHRFDGSGHGKDQVAGLALAPDGTSVFVTGRSRGANGVDDVITLAYDATTGVRRWVARYSSHNTAGTRNAWGNDIAVRADGKLVLVAGARGSARNDHEAVVLAYGPAFGRLRWVGARPATSPGHDEAAAIVVKSDGVAFVTGTARGSDYGTMSFARGGALRWDRIYDAGAPYGDLGGGIALAPDGSAIYVVGRPEVVAYSDLGVRMWTAPSAGPLWDSAVAVTPDGARVVATGVTESMATGFAAAGYDAATGGRAWHGTWGANPLTAGYRSGIALSPDGARVYATGCVDFTGMMDLRRAVAAFATA